MGASRNAIQAEGGPRGNIGSRWERYPGGDGRGRIWIRSQESAGSTGGRVNRKNSEFEPTGNSEPKSALKLPLSTSSKICAAPESMPMCAMMVCSW